jgi:hypothetical protein
MVERELQKAVAALNIQFVADARPAILHDFEGYSQKAGADRPEDPAHGSLSI